MLSFTIPWVFFLLPLPFFVSKILKPIHLSKTDALKVPFYEHIKMLQSSPILNKSYYKTIFMYLLWALVVFAASGPYMIYKPVGVPRETRNIMMAIDISDSMAYTDMSFNNRYLSRIESVKLIGSNFIEDRVGDRVGLVLFGTQAYLQAPLTYDRKTVARLLLESDLKLAGPATAIGNAMGLSIKHLNTGSKGDKIILLLTDGKDTASTVSVDEMADIAKKNNVKIYIIGIGSVESQTSIDEDLLKKIANTTGGNYFRADSGFSLQQIYNHVNEIEPVVEEGELFYPTYHLYPWVLGFGFILSMMFTAFFMYRESNYA